MQRVSPRPKPRTQSPAPKLTSSPYELRKRHRHELSDAIDGSDSEFDESMDEQSGSHLNSSSRYTEEHSISYSSSRGDGSYNEYSRESGERSYMHSSPKVVHESVPLPSRHQFAQSTPKQYTALWIFFMATVVATIVVVLFIYGIASTKQLIAPKEPISCPQFIELNKHFLHQDLLLWKSLRIGIENVLNKNPAKPSVFLLAYTDVETTKNLMAKIINATANCMRSSSPIQLNGATFATAEMINDYGEIIAKYRDQLQQEKIMYVSDVNKTPVAAAQVFHAICDTIEPLVEKAVIFLTVYLEPGSYEQNGVLRTVEQVLETDWMDDSVSENTLKALIGRVTDQVFLVHSERV